MKTYRKFRGLLHVFYTNPSRSVITILRELEVLKDSQDCCGSKPIYEITYNLGTKWLVCNECLDLEEFSQDIKEKVRIQT